jgi:hypothetical protein
MNEMMEGKHESADRNVKKLTSIVYHKKHLGMKQVTYHQAAGEHGSYNAEI